MATGRSARCRGSAARRARLRRLGADVERRRRLDGAVRGAVASQPAVGLQAALARGHRGRLAADLRGAGAVLPADRARLRDLRPRRRSGLPGHRYPLPPLRLREWGIRLARAHNALGWHWWPGSNAIATRPYGRLRACTDRGSCMFGCPERAKASPDLTHWPDAHGVRLLTRAHAIRIETDSRGRAGGVVYVRDGAEHRQRARVVILAGNAIGTPWLLLSSATPAHPEGLANSSGLVGRRLMVHPFGAVVGVFEEELCTWPSPSGSSSTRSSSTRPTSAAGSRAAPSGRSRPRTARWGRWRTTRGARRTAGASASTGPSASG